MDTALNRLLQVNAAPPIKGCNQFRLRSVVTMSQIPTNNTANSTRISSNKMIKVILADFFTPIKFRVVVNNTARQVHSHTGTSGIKALREIPLNK